MRNVATIILILFSLVGLSQDKEVSLSLSEAIDLAFQKNTQILNSNLDIQYAKTQVNEVKAQGYPQISANTDISNTFKIPTQIIPGDFIGQPGTTIPAQFGVPFNANASVGIRQLLFDGTFFLGLKAASEFVKISELNAKSTATEIKMGIIKAYYMVLIADKNLIELEKSYVNMLQLQEETKAMYTAGILEKLDVDRITLAVSNLEININSMKNQAILSKQLLLNSIGIDVNQKLILTTSLPSEINKDLSLSTFNPDDRIEIQLLNQQQRLNHLDLKRYKVGYMPSIYGNFSYGSSTFASEDNFSDIGADWYGNGRYGLGLSLPLFDGFYKKSKMNQIKIKIEQTENYKNQALRGVSLEINQAKINYDDAQRTLNIQQNNKQLAEYIYHTTAIKFKEGIGSSFELITSDNDLTQSKINYLNALYSLNIAHINLEKALGKL